MKDFFKKHPELLFLLVGVIVVDCAIMWIWLGDTSVTEESRKKIEQLRGQATKINESDYAITNANAAKSQDESEKWSEAFAVAYELEASKYTLETLYRKGMSGASAKKVFKDKVNELIDEVLVEKNKTSNKLSFGEYDGDKLFSFTAEQVERIFEILSATEELMGLCVDSDIISIDSIERPTDLEYSDDASLKLRSYTFKLNVTASAEGVKQLMNQISSDENFYFEINGFKLSADEQISVGGDDLRPNKERAQSSVKKPSGGGFEDELDRIRGGAPKSTGGAKMHEESVAPFVDAIIHLELTVDWVQFLKEKKK